jgi:hypothetical protein
LRYVCIAKLHHSGLCPRQPLPALYYAKRLQCVETADALQEIVDVVRTIEGRLPVLEGKGHPRSSAEMEQPNRR